MQASRHGLRLTMKHALRAWQRFAVADRHRLAALERRANALRRQHILRRALRAWARLPALQRDERERERWRLGMRAKVAALLPDFAPHHESH